MEQDHTVDFGVLLSADIGVISLAFLQWFIIFQNPQFFPRLPPQSLILSQTTPLVFVHVSIGAHMPGRWAHAQCENSKKGDLQMNKLR